MNYNVSIFYQKETKYVFHQVDNGNVTMNMEVWIAGKEVSSNYFVGQKGSVLELSNGIKAR